MQTQREIKTYLADGGLRDVLPAATATTARPYIGGARHRRMWKTDADVTAAIEDTVVAAWVDARCHRGPATIAAVEKLRALLWLIDKSAPTMGIHQSLQFQAPFFAVVASLMDLPVPEDSTIQAMIEGRVCPKGPGCGCVDIFSHRGWRIGA